MSSSAPTKPTIRFKCATGIAGDLVLTREDDGSLEIMIDDATYREVYHFLDEDQMRQLFSWLGVQVHKT